MSLRTSARNGSALKLRGVIKRYGDVVAVDDVSLEVRSGEFVTLLGPSGSGKTTTLNIIAGFVRPDVGTIVVDEKDVTGLPPHKRNTGMVFQNYALFPHMTAAKNVAFPLEMRKVPRRESNSRVEDALELVHLGGLGGRYPRQLSGGQQQRVALARALVFNPRALLMDEPLGSLDKKLRETLQLEIMRISHQIGVTVIYVTHDQEEALAMSDRIAIYNDGRIEQVGTGEELYERPVSLFVANFVGESTVFRGSFERGKGASIVLDGNQRIWVSGTACEQAGLKPGDGAAVLVRPERLKVRETRDDAAITLPRRAATFRGTVQSAVFLGSMRKYVIDLEDGTVAVARYQVGREDPNLTAGAAVEVSWVMEDGVIVADHAARDRAEAKDQGLESMAEEQAPFLVAPGRDTRC